MANIRKTGRIVGTRERLLGDGALMRRKAWRTWSVNRYRRGCPSTPRGTSPIRRTMDVLRDTRPK